MVTIRRGSTPTLSVRLDADVTGAEPLRVAIRSRHGTDVYDGDRLSTFSTLGGPHLVVLTLTQEETLAFEAGEVLRLQVKGKTDGDEVPVSDVALMRVGEVLDEQVI